MIGRIANVARRAASPGRVVAGLGGAGIGVGATIAAQNYARTERIKAKLETGMPLSEDEIPIAEQLLASGRVSIPQQSIALTDMVAIDPGANVTTPMGY